MEMYLFPPYSQLAHKPLSEIQRDSGLFYQAEFKGASKLQDYLIVGDSLHLGQGEHLCHTTTLWKADSLHPT